MSVNDSHQCDGLIHQAGLCCPQREEPLDRTAATEPEAELALLGGMRGTWRLEEGLRNFIEAFIQFRCHHLLRRSESNSTCTFLLPGPSGSRPKVPWRGRPHAPCWWWGHRAGRTIKGVRFRSLQPTRHGQPVKSKTVFRCV